MSENVAYQGSIEICRDGKHVFELRPVAGRWAIVEGESRCRACGALADEIRVDGRPTRAVHLIDTRKRYIQ
jgi:hypothetical protein